MPREIIPSQPHRRRAVAWLILVLSMLIPPGLAPAAHAAPDAPGAATERSLKIGIIGAGRIGGLLGELWVRAGHEVLLSSRHPDRLAPLARRLGPRARAGLPRAAAKFGDIVLVSVPYGAVPQIGRDFASELKGKIVLETGNPFPHRDGAMAAPARARGVGRASAEFLPGVRLVRAFNSVGAFALRSGAHRDGAQIAIPLAGDDAGALKTAARLVRDAGFEPVIVGGLDRARKFDVGTAVWGRALTADELRRHLGLSR